MKRVLVLGPPGAGKSVLAHLISEKLMLPLVSLDEIYWGKNWQPMEKEAFRHECQQLAQEESWVMDGNFGVTFQERWSRADTVIYLCPSVWLCVFRQILRALGIYTSLSRPKNCQERFNQDLFWFTYKFDKAHGKLIETKMREDFPHPRFYKVASIKEATEKLNLN